MNALRYVSSGVLGSALLLAMASPAPAAVGSTVLGQGPPAVAGTAGTPTPNPLDVRQGGSILTSLDVRPGSGFPNRLLAPGNPPLTQQTADNLAGFFEWLLDAPLTQGQRQEIQEAAVEVWQRGDMETMANILGIVQAFGQVVQLGETQRMQVRQELQPALLAEARQHPGNDLSRWMLQVYDAAHVSIAPGTPPLTRQVAEAYAEVQHFLLGVVATGQARPIEQDFGPTGRDVWVQAIADDYPRYGPEYQRKLTEMPLFRAAIGEAWPALTAAEQTQLRNQWRPVVEAMLAETNCDTFASLARSDLVEPTDAHLARYGSCTAPAASPSTGSQARVEARPEDLRLTEDDVRLDVNPNAYTFLSNLQTTSHVGSMNMLSIMGGSPYRYTTVYRR
jgi:hypothetical protein